MAEEEKKKIPVRKIIKITITLILVSLFAYVFFSNIFKQDNEMKSVFGVNFAIVQTGSMVDGGFDVGDFVLIKKINAEKTTLKVGDIIEIKMGEKVLKVEVLKILEHALKDDACLMYKIL